MAEEVSGGRSVWRSLVSGRQLMLLIVGAALFLRLWGIGFGFPGKYRPDEEYLVSRALGVLGGDLNPHLFLYPSLYIYLLAGVMGLLRWGAALAGAMPGMDFGRYLEAAHYVPAHLAGRCCTALLGVLTVYFLARLGKRIFGAQEGRLAAGLLAVNFLHVRDAHYVTTDVPMTFLVVAALWVMINVAQRGAWKDYLWAGIITGLATGTKYSAVMLVVSLLLAHLARMRRGRELFSLRAGAQLAGAYAAAAAAFCLSSPFLFLAWPEALRDLQYQVDFYRNGYPSIPMSYGWQWLVGFALRYGAGAGVTALAGAGLLLGLRGGAWGATPGRLAIIPAGFLLASLPTLLESKLLMLRYAVPLMPLLALFAAHGAAVVGASLPRARWARALAVALVVFAGMDSLGRSVELDRLLQRTDTRNLARLWVKENIPAGERIAVHSDYYYGKPELPRGYHYIRLSGAAPRESAVRWLMVDESPIDYYSPALDEEWLAGLGTARLAVRFDPFSDDRRERPVYDLRDAFYLPLSGFGAVSRPGPLISIYRIERAGP